MGFERGLKILVSPVQVWFLASQVNQAKSSSHKRFGAFLFYAHPYPRSTSWGKTGEFGIKTGGKMVEKVEAKSQR
jgi:hypothetical protein